MKMPSRKVAVISALAVIALVGAVFFMTRPPHVETCFDRMGGPGPNSNTSRLDTYLDIPASQWPAVAQIFRDFAAEHHWSIWEDHGTSDPTYASLDMCDDQVTIVRASNRQGEQYPIGFGIIHMTYEGPGNDGWQPFYRDLHRRLEARWPGRMHYIEGEFGQTIERPDWLGELEAPPGNDESR